MDKKLFRDLTGALKDAAAFERGEKIDLRVAKLPRPPKALPANEIIRLRTSLAMSQAVFARYLNVTPSTVKSWEQGIRSPSRAALKLLHIVKNDPRVLAMAELKTKQNDQSVEKFLNRIADKKTRAQCFTILEMMKQITKTEPKMWGSSIVGFGNYHYKYESGREGDWLLTGFSPRKQNLTLYIMSGFGRYDELMKKLGKHKTGKSCLYINKLEDVDLPMLKKLIQGSFKHMTKTRA
jgi:DNA-binding transcriptional regulator YiaG